MSAEWALIAAGALAGGFMNGLAGFGVALFALGFWLQVLPPVEAIAMTVVSAAVTGLQGLWLVRREILAQQRRLVRFLLPALLGVPFGVMLLQFVEPRGLRLLVAALMLAYGLFFLLRGKLPAFTRPTPVADMGIGVLSGVLGGLGGLSGAPAAMWCALRPWPRHETRAVLQPLSFTLLLVMTAVFAWRGVYTPELMQKTAFAIALSISAAQLGIFAFRRVSDTAFRWLIIALMLVSGASLMLREVF